MAVVKGCDRSPRSTTPGQGSTGRNDRRRKKMASNEELKRSKARERPSKKEARAAEPRLRKAG